MPAELPAPMILSRVFPRDMIRTWGREALMSPAVKNNVSALPVLC